MGFQNPVRTGKSQGAHTTGWVCEKCQKGWESRVHGFTPYSPVLPFLHRRTLASRAECTLWVVWGPSRGIALQPASLTLNLGVAGRGSITGSQVSECRQADNISSPNALPQKVLSGHWLHL